MADESYFVMSDTGEIPGRWYLNHPTTCEGEEVDPWQFTAGQRLDFREPLVFTQFQHGRALPFSLAAYEIPVVDEETGNVLRAVSGDDLELLPAIIEGQDAPFWIANVVNAMECVDEARSRFTRFTPEHHPDRAGEYQMFIELKIDPARVVGHQVFRIKGWEAPLIVSDRVRTAMEARALPGLVFTPV